MSSKMDRNPVISLIIVESSAFSSGRFIETGRVLVCVRDPVANGDHHPNVLSVPTQRIPKVLLEVVKNGCLQFPVHNRESSIALKSDWADNSTHNGHNPVIYSVEALLSEKLGINEAERGPDSCPFRAKPVWIESGNALYSKRLGERDELEPIDMLGMLVLVRSKNEFPKSTRSYSRILWPSISQFLLAYEKKDVQCVDPTLNAIELCIHGLCVAGAYEFLKRHVVSQPASRNKEACFAATC